MIVEPHQTIGDVHLDADVVVIGSGAGGSTVAATAAEAGLRVIVLEEGGYYTTKDYGANITEMMGKVMRDGGSTVLMGRSPIPYLEGRCVGGSTVINGGMCWRTPDHILDEWVSERGLTELAPSRLESYFERVEKVINARHQDPGSEGTCNQVFKRGADQLGWRLSQNKRNQVHCVGSNDCVTGCPSGAKQSTLYSWLPRFFRAGGTLFTRMRVTKILTEAGRATGVAGILNDPFKKRRFSIKADAVVLSCGAIQTPLLLQRNKLCRPCDHVGKHFTIHPNVKVAALFDDPVDSMRGTHQAWQCTEFVDEGILLAPGAIPTAFMSAVFPSFGRQLAEKMKLARYIATGGVLVDDHAEGRIRTLPFGVPYVRYDVTDVDQSKFIRAAGLLARLYFEAGAREVYTAFHHWPVLRSVDDIARMQQAKPSVESTEYFTAHIMGTCRMSNHPSEGVVGPDGQAWDVPGLFIADASVLPGTIGVNPQVTIMALALLIGERIAERRRGS